MTQTSEEFTLHDRKGVETEICKNVIYDQQHCLVFITREIFQTSTARPKKQEPIVRSLQQSL
jgi:hypothetical protein